MNLNRLFTPFVPAEETVNLSQLRPHPEEPERSEGVSKDGRKSEPAAMVRDGALRAPPHHEAERVELVLNRQDLKDSLARKRGPSSWLSRPLDSRFRGNERRLVQWRWATQTPPARTHRKI